MNKTKYYQHLSIPYQDLEVIGATTFTNVATLYN
jgi:hypothetical protein